MCQHSFIRKVEATNLLTILNRNQWLLLRMTSLSRSNLDAVLTSFCSHFLCLCLFRILVLSTYFTFSLILCFTYPFLLLSLSVSLIFFVFLHFCSILLTHSPHPTLHSSEPIYCMSCAIVMIYHVSTMSWALYSGSVLLSRTQMR